MDLDFARFALGMAVGITVGALLGYVGGDWIFDDGFAGSGISTTHSYTDAGEYDVTLTITDDTAPTPMTDVTNRTVRILEDSTPPAIVSSMPPIGPV